MDEIRKPPAARCDSLSAIDDVVTWVRNSKDLRATGTVCGAA
jgi:hypothetical protein